MGAVSPGPARTSTALVCCFAVAGAMVYYITHAQPGGSGEALPEVAAEAVAEVGSGVAALAVPELGAAPGNPLADEAGAMAGMVAPSVDVVRVTPEGAALVAGRAAPGARVTIYADTEAIAEAEADAEGNFVAMFTAEPTGEARSLRLGSVAARGGAEIRSEDLVVLLPEATVAEASGQDMAEGAEAPEAPVDIASVVIAGAEDRVEVTPLARPSGVAAERVSLASISYAGDGNVALAGFGPAQTRVRAYVDGAFVEEEAIGPDGRWSLALEDVLPGLYQLRVDQIGADGRVVSRVETPFKRELPPARAPGDDGAAPQVRVVVQPGNNLWTLALIHYGSGVLYTQIFNANSDLIGDPDLIYPGQIFRVPEQAGE